MTTDSPLRLPKISIVMPCFNQAEFLPFAIESVISQDYPDLEFILIDGGSTDGSLDIIRQYENHFSYWQSGKDSGQSDAINQGFNQASGDIVAWLNSDDLYLPGALMHAAKCFATDSQLDLLYGDCVFIDKDGQFIRYFTECEPYDPKRIRNYSDFIMQPTTFFKRRTLKRIGLLNTTLHYTMDWDLWARFSKAGAKVKYLPRVQAANREYENTKTTSGGIKRLWEILLTNMRNMTGFWPNAFFGFTAYEMYQQFQKFPPLIRYYGCLSAQVVAVMSLNPFVGPKSLALYGLMPHSPRCTENPEFFIPHYEKHKPSVIKIDFSLDSEKEADVVVIVNQVLVYHKQVQTGSDEQLLIPIGSKVKRANCYHITPKFFRNRRPIAPIVHSIKLLTK